MTATVLKTINEEVREIFDDRIAREALLTALVSIKDLAPEAANVVIVRQCALQLASFIEELIEVGDRRSVDIRNVFDTARSELDVLHMELLGIEAADLEKAADLLAALSADEHNET